MLLSVYFFYNTTETTERSICDFNSLINLVWNGNFLATYNSLFSCTKNPVNISLTNRGRVIQTTKKSQNIRHKTECMGNFTLKICLNQDITRKEKLFFYNALTVAKLSILLCRQQNLTNISCQQRIVFLKSLKIFLYLGLFTTNGTEHIPLHSCLSHLSK